ncbi:MAG: hypothetical protein C3F07_02265 [Anaerolineales bacterium]|nr:hypothetical protein [Anaerolineae bacterium]PWB77365.1 MAG: hypothetical protein C3F07_02265 [Anaerolineales bacterium]
MFVRKYKLLLLFVGLTLIFASCGTSPQTEAEISTAVAQTVQAQNSLTKIANVPTQTPKPPTVEVSSTPENAQTATSAPIGNPGCTVSASLIGENPPDNVLVKPGELFWKTWTLQNTGTCTWNTSYNLVFWDGDLMGGLTSYPLPEPVAPNETKDISIYLKAPEVEGTATGYWRIQTPWGTNFGVGSGDASFYVQVNVSTQQEYGITNVSYNLVRDPLTGCPTNVRYTVYATITTNGPFAFDYYWDQSDGNESSVKTITLKEAGSVTLNREWMIGKGDSPNPRWIQLIVTGPEYQEYDKVTILNNCP